MKSYKIAAHLRRASLALTAVLALVVVDNAALGTPQSNLTKVVGGSKNIRTYAAPADTQGIVSFGTSQSRFRPGVDNQGSINWQGHYGDMEWHHGSYLASISDNCYFGDYSRPYFSFDLSSLTPGTVSRATLVLQRYGMQGAGGVLALHEVTTGAEALNMGTADTSDTYSDLADGPLFGQYTLTDVTADPNTNVRLQLNGLAVATINERAGHFFSVGGLLLSPQDHPCITHSLFRGSGTPGLQRLVLRTDPMTT